VQEQQTAEIDRDLVDWPDLGCREGGKQHYQATRLLGLCGHYTLGGGAIIDGFSKWDLPLLAREAMQAALNDSMGLMLSDTAMAV